jgi:hypothetical protein
VELLRFPALGEEQRHVSRPHDTEVAVQGVYGMQEDRGSTGGRERRRDFSGDDSRFSQAGHDHPPRRIEDRLRRAHKRFTEPILEPGYRGRFHSDHPTSGA